MNAAPVAAPIKEPSMQKPAPMPSKPRWRERIVFVVYVILAYLLRPLLLLGILWRSRADADYRQRWWQRLGWGYATCKPDGILVHAVSMGEVVAATPLIEALLALPDAPVVTVTCSTPTGARLLQQRFGARIQHGFLPIDTPGAAKRFLRQLKPHTFIILETELWPCLIRQARRDGIEVHLVNARLSARSARGYRRFAWITQPMLRQLHSIGCADSATLRRYRRFVPAGGAPSCYWAGNLKFDMQVPTTLSAQTAALQPYFYGRRVLVVGSTHPGEDELLLKVLPRLQAAIPEVLLLLVPRHPVRFAEVAQLLRQADVPFVQRSLQQWPNAHTSVMLGDSMGELMLWYQLADLVLVGGSLIPQGGHNPLEPMALGKAQLAGPFTFNFAAIYQLLDKGGAVARVECDVQALSDSLIYWLSADDARQQLAIAGSELYPRLAGATARYMSHLFAAHRA
jgi:3-deoxy-D-manno-octulosonic-acid transferase